MTPDDRNLSQEHAALLAAEEAFAALKRAIAAYQDAGFGSLVTAPLAVALAEVSYSIREASQ